MSKSRKSKGDPASLSEFNLIITNHLADIYGDDKEKNNKALYRITKTIREIEIETSIIRGEIFRDLLRQHVDNNILQEFLDIIIGVKIL